MIEVLPIQSKSEQEQVCNLCSVDYNENFLAYAAQIDEKFVAVCQFRVTKQGGLIYDLACVNIPNSFEILFILGRAALNFIDLCEVHEAFLNSPNFNEKLATAIGFNKNIDGRYYIDLTNLFKNPCQHN
jgi:hypothetical protein